MAKPIEEKEYRKHIKRAGWSLRKGSIDYNLYNESGDFMCTIKIIHGKGKKREVSASSVRATKKLYEEDLHARGLKWPPKKELKKK